MSPIGSPFRAMSGSIIDPAPEVSMFNSPIYQWSATTIGVSDGGTISTWNDTLASISASAVGDPVYRDSQSGKKAVDTDGSGDGFDWSADSQIPTGSDPFSFAGTVYMPSGEVDSNNTLVAWGNWGTAEEANQFYTTGATGRINHIFYSNDLEGSTIPTDQWTTIGMSYDGTNRQLYIGGSPDVSDSPGAVNVQNSNHGILYSRPANNYYHAGYTYDIVVSDVAESDQAFADYHNARIN